MLQNEKDHYPFNKMLFLSLIIKKATINWAYGNCKRAFLSSHAEKRITPRSVFWGFKREARKITN